MPLVYTTSCVLTKAAFITLTLTENGPKKRKYPESGICLDENALLMSENGQTG